LRNTDWSNPRVLDKLNRIGGSLQNIENSHSNYVKYDEYTVELDHMPPGVTPELYLEAMATDLNSAISNNDFNKVNVFTRPDTGTPEVGSVYGITIKGGDNGSVILVESTPSSFTLHTIETTNQGTHPENGVREFGFNRIGDNKVEFYTRGVSQANFAGFLTDPIAKYYQGVGWTAFLKGIADGMKRLNEERGGDPISYKIKGGQICQQDEYNDGKRGKLGTNEPPTDGRPSCKDPKVRAVTEDCCFEGSPEDICYSYSERH
jgi:hypothetical protein